VLRQGEGAANGTINRERAVLGKMLRLAVARRKLVRVPEMVTLKAAPRQGFFESWEYGAVRRHLPVDLQVACDLEQRFGWRMQSEVLTLERRQLDLVEGSLTLDPGRTKNDDARTGVYLTAELKVALSAQQARVEALERKLGRLVPYLFAHLSGKKQVGTRIKDFRLAWKAACRKAGVEGRLRHDLRRTAVRNLVRSGVNQHVAMAITGHRTESVFRRYKIISKADLQAAALKLEGHISGTVEAKPVSEVLGIPTSAS
jgi:integrase